VGKKCRVVGSLAWEGSVVFGSVEYRVVGSTVSWEVSFTIVWSIV
jgi:hypothetical protein